jgi:hypothetical protein
MRMARLLPAAGLAFLTLLAGGCVWGDLTTSHNEPGGTVTAMMDNRGPRSSTAIGDATGDPFTVSGFSPVLTFGLTAPATATQPLSMNGASVQINVAPGTSPALEIHSDGTGCAAQTAVVHLNTDGDGHLNGDFSGTGLVSGSQIACTLSGTLQGIPFNH